MARRLQYLWPPSVSGQVCPLQTLTAGGPLSLNTTPGGYYNPLNQSLDFLQKGFSRSVLIISSHDLSGVNFAVTGLQNGAVVTETVKGENGSVAAESQFTYDQILSIQSDQAAAGVRVDLGVKGYFKMLALNLEKDYLNYAASMTLSSNSQMNYSIYYTPYDITGNQLSFDTMISDQSNSSYFFYYTTVDKDNFFYPSHNLTPFLLIPFYLIRINSCVVADTATLTFIQI